MPQWKNSNRKSRLPADWSSLRRKVLERDGNRCRWTYPNGGRCSEKATDVDHIRPGDDHSMENLRSLCTRHHRFKSSSEGAQALNKKKTEIHNRFRRSTKDPGFL